MNAISEISASDRYARRVETPQRVCRDHVRRHSATDETRRARRADMSRADFIKLVAGWGGGVVLVFFISIFVRYVSLN
jgi:hypothetical protein